MPPTLPAAAPWLDAPRVLHAAHDHMWLAWAPPRFVPSHAVSAYNVLQRLADGSASTSSATKTVFPVSELTGGLVAKISNLKPATPYSFAVQALPHAVTGLPPATSRLSVPALTATGPDALLVVGRWPASPSDTTLRRHLQNLGLRVHVASQGELRNVGGEAALREPRRLARLWSVGTEAEDEDDSSALPETPRLLVLAPSCRAAGVRAWRAVSAGTASPTALPLAALVLSAHAWSPLGLSGDASCAPPAVVTRSRARLLSLGPLHAPLLAGRRAGPVTLLEGGAPASLHACPPPRGAHVVAAADAPGTPHNQPAGGPAAAVHFALEAGIRIGVPDDALGGAPIGAPGSAPRGASRRDRGGVPTTHRLVAYGLDEVALDHLSPDGIALLTAGVRWALGEAHVAHVPEWSELFAQQQRRQARTLFSLEAVHVVAGRALRDAYLEALREAAVMRRQARLAALPGAAPGAIDGSDARARAQGDARAAAAPPPCAHCHQWPSRPLFAHFSSAVDAIPPVSNADIVTVYRAYVSRQLAPLKRSGGVSAARVEAAARLGPSEWNLRLQIVRGVAYVVGPPPALINHHHRKRLRGLAQLFAALLTNSDGDTAALPNVDLALNLGDAPKVVPMPRRRPEDAAAPSGEVDAGGELSALLPPPNCAGFEWPELGPAVHGPFGPVSGSDNLLRENGFANSSVAGGARLPLFTATSCCFAADLSFPTAWYDFDTSDEDFAALAAEAERAAPRWAERADAAYFRGSLYWYEAHGRTRAFARSLVHPREVDADWYDEIVTSALEGDGQHTAYFGNASAFARRKYLLSLEGHSFWSFRLRSLAFLGSAVLHQDSPCHEFWHVLLRPFEHYLPLKRDLSNLMTTLRYARAHATQVEAMAQRLRALAHRLLSRRGVVAYVRELLTQYAALQTEPVTLHAGARPLAQMARAWEAAGGSVSERSHRFTSH